MGRIRQALLCGYGGQGIVLAGTILGHAAFRDGRWVSGTNSFGSAARGGACRSEVVISERPVVFPYVIEADVLVAMYQTAYNKYMGQVKPDGGVVVYDDSFVSPEEVDGLKFISIPATRTAIEALNSEITANMIILAAAVEITGLVTRQALKSTVADIVAERLRELDLKALDIGFDLGRAAK
jgi:2-oxoglutarate ferredoxin oxidoreductase subunit gamma